MLVLSGEVVNSREEMAANGRMVYTYDVKVDYGVRTEYLVVKAWREVPKDEFKTGVTVLPGTIWKNKVQYTVFDRREGAEGE